MDAADARGAGREEEHVAVAEELLGALRVEDRARVDLRRHLIADARREVRLDHAGDDVDRRPLRGDDEMDADRARLLRQARHRILDVLRRHHHQVGELVDDDDDVDCSGSGTFTGSPFRQLHRAAIAVDVLQQRVVLIDVAHAALGEAAVAILHLVHGPDQRVRGELRDR